jgi:hypothetical protein
MKGDACLVDASWQDTDEIVGARRLRVPCLSMLFIPAETWCSDQLARSDPCRE